MTKSVTDTNFNQAVVEASKEKPVLVDMWATWCPPCRAMAPVVEDIDQNHEALTVVKLDVDENPATAAAYRVQSIPTFILFKDGVEVGRTMGAMPKDRLLAQFGEHLA